MNIHIKILCTIFLILGMHTAASAQTITLSAPSSGGSVVDNAAVVFSISGETVGISTVQLVFKYTSGYLAANVGRIDTLTLVSTSATQSFSFNPSTAASNTTRFSKAVNLPDGMYSMYVQYTRAGIKTIIRSGSATATTAPFNITNVTFDTQALPPTMFSPLANVKLKAKFSYKDSLLENYASTTRKVTFLSAATGESSVLTLPNSVRVQSYTFNAKSLALPGVSVTGSNTLADGTYQISLEYRDIYSHNSTPVSRFITIDSKSQPPEIISPPASGRQSTMLDMVLNIPEKISSGTAKLLFKKSGGGTDSLVLASPAYGVNSLQVNLKNIAASAAVSSSSTASLADGQYDIIFKYADSLGNTAASDTLSSMQLDNSTLAPEISSPTDSTLLRQGDKLNLNFTLLETPLAGSVKAVFSKSGLSSSVFLNSSSSGAQSFELDPSAISNSIGVLSSGTDYLADGIYDLLLSYQDEWGNSADSSAAVKVLIDRATQKPLIVSPADSAIVSGNMDLSFNLPEMAKNNQVILKLRGCEDIDIVLQVLASGSQVFSINPNDLTNSPGVISTSKTAIIPGFYTLIIGYQDTLSNTMVYTSKSGISF